MIRDETYRRAQRLRQLKSLTLGETIAEALELLEKSTPSDKNWKP